MDRDRLRARRAVRDAALDGDPDRRNARAHRCGHAPEEPAWRLCRCGRLEPGARPSSTVASDTAACCPTACPCRLAARLSPRSQSRSEEHTSELQSLMPLSYAVFCLTKKHYTQC